MREMNQDLSSDVKKVIDSNIDAMDLQSGTQLELENLQLELTKVKLQQEIQAHKAYKLKNKYKPDLIATLKCVVWFGYALFVILLFSNDINPNNANFRTVALILTGVIPTAILLVVVKAMFSNSRDDDNGIEAAPTLTVIKEASKSFE